MVVTHAGYRGHVLGTAFSPDGQFLATASAIEQQGGAKGEVKFWDAATGAELSTFNDHAAEVFCVAFNRDGKRWASCSADGTIHLHEVAGGRVLSLNGHTGEVWFVAYSPDGTRLASASHDQTVRLWDTVTGQEALSLKGDTRFNYSIAFSPDGHRLAAGSVDGVKVWYAPHNVR